MPRHRPTWRPTRGRRGYPFSSLAGALIALAGLLQWCWRLSPPVPSSWTGKALFSSDVARTRPRRRTAFVHIGPQKTATSYIQTRMCDDIEWLAQHGIVVPISKNKTCYPKHFANVGRALKHEGLPAASPRPGRSAWDAFTDDIQGIVETQPASSIFLSAEAFAKLYATNVEVLARMLYRYFDDVQVVAFYRPKLEQMLSIYAQRNKRVPRPSTLTQFVFQNLTDIAPIPRESPTPSTTPELDYFCFECLVTMYANAFGLANVHVVSYAGLNAAGRDPWDAVVEDVMGLPPPLARDSGASSDTEQGTDAPPTKEKGRVNVSPDYLELSAFAALRQLVLAWAAGGVFSIPARMDTDKVASCGAKMLQGAWKGSLPMTCTSMQSMVLLWEREERAFLAALRGRAHLQYFQEDKNGDLVWTNATTTHKACDVDVNALVSRLGEEAGSSTDLQDRIQEIEQKCFVDEKDEE